MLPLQQSETQWGKQWRAPPAVAPAQVGFNSYKVASNSTNGHFGPQCQQPSACWMATAIPLTTASTLGLRVNKNKALREASSVLPQTITEHTSKGGQEAQWTNSL